MYDYMKALQKRFDRQEHSELDAQIKSAHEELRRDMDAAGRKKLLRLLDAQNTLLVESKLMSFTAGFKLAWGMAKELEADGFYSFDGRKKNTSATRQNRRTKWRKNVQMAKATFANAQTGVGRVATQQATTPKQESGSSKMCWERRRRNARRN